MENEKQKEITLMDIVGLCSKLARAIVLKIKNFIVWFIRFIFKGKWILLTAAALGFLFSIYQSRPANLYYKGEVEMRFNIYDAYFYKDLINTLNLYCDTKERTSLTNTLNISNSQAQSIVSINSYFYIDLMSDGTPDEIDYKNKFNPADTLNRRMKDRLRLVVMSKDTTLYPVLINKLKGYFAQNMVITGDNIVRLQQIDERIEEIVYEIRMLDSLRKIEYFRQVPTYQAKLDGGLYLNEKERKLYHNDMLNLENQKKELQWEKEVQPESVRFMSPFKVSPKTQNGLMKTSMKYVPLFLLLGFVATIGWRYWRDIYRFLSEEK